MKTPTLLAIAFATALAAHAQSEEVRPPFVPRMTSLAGASLQPASGVSASSGLGAARGLEPSAAYRGRAPIVSRPMTEEEWRRIFPKRPGQP